MAAISVITPTIRKDGLPLVMKALKRQTFEDFEWIIGSYFNVDHIIENMNVDMAWIKDEYKDGIWSLNRIYNDLIVKSRGELIVSWQDFTYANPDALEKFWNNYQATKGAVSGVGNKYADETWSVKTWQDPRERADQGSFYACTPQDIEFNFCAVPKQSLCDIGGFDEEMDFLGFGMDGVSVAERLDAVGCMTYLDQSNKSYSVGHSRPKGWDEHNLLGQGYFKRRQELFDKGEWPRLQWLSIEEGRTREGRSR